MQNNTPINTATPNQTNHKNRAINVWFFSGLVLLLLIAGLVTLKNRKQTLDLTGVAFGSMAWHVRIADVPEGLSRGQIITALEQELDKVDASLSSWRADSEVSQFNRLEADTPFKVSPLLYQSLIKVDHVTKQMPQTYDVTIAPLIDLYGFGAQGRPDKIPTQAQIDAAKQRIGWQHISINLATKPPYSINKQQPVQINLSSLGEGAGVDLMRVWLEAQGVKNYMVSVAGTVAVKGKNHGKNWQVAIEKPDATQMVSSVLSLSDAVISTSGSYRNYYEQDGVRYSHTIDPQTGKPITHHGVSVTLVSPLTTDSYLATEIDAMTTGLNVLGPQKGLDFANQQGLAAYYIESAPDDKNAKRQLTGKSSQAFEAYL